MTIGELAARFGLATHVLRHWEAVGVVTPSERVNGRRTYGPEHFARVALVLRAKTAGLTLEQIRRMLEAPDPASRRPILERHLAELERRAAEIEMARQMIEHALHCPEQDFTKCLDFQRIADDPESGRGERRAP